ncbi:ABC transporter ATP-binding protein [Dactylosporangium sp. NPDC006015]|uniref:ABC transporter ATP-binding protein n=1 Tax=Dactylosporangium sp. NPDC006015 TaxID=3154576 RepID=UPI0033B6C327
MTPIEVHGLRKAYGGIPAIDGISLAVGPGEIFALLGPNGAGKSTTVEILEGHRRRDSGDVRVLGEDPFSAGRRWRSRIGIVLQTATDAADLTVRETVRHYSRFYPAPRDPSLVLDLVGLSDKAGARVRTLSGGQRRRVDVALGIIGNPALVFLDEPTTGFDPEARRQFWALIRSLAADGTTVLLTTHYLEEAAALADRLAIIAGGRIVAAGTPSTVGGLARAQATVTWRDGTGLHEVRTDSPNSVVAALPPDALDLQIRRPSLEDVYLDLIGARS